MCVQLLPAKVAAARSQSLTVGVTEVVRMQVTAAQTMTMCVVSVAMTMCALHCMCMSHEIRHYEPYMVFKFCSVEWYINVYQHLTHIFKTNNDISLKGKAHVLLYLLFYVSY